MTAFVALLRGINVGGAGKLAMADLRRIAEGCGFADVRTYVQSGNVVFRTAGSAANAAAALRSALAAGASIDPAIAIRTAPQLASVVERCPFDDTANVHVTFVVEGAKRVTTDIAAEQFEPERFAVGRREIYLYLPNGIGRSKLAATLGRGGAAVDGTTRNWRTVTTLLEMARD